MIRRHRAGYTLTFLAHSEINEPTINWSPLHLAHGTWLWRLHLHYMEFLEEVDDAEFVSIIEDWIERNPPYRPNYWRDNWNSYAISIRTVVWLQQLAVRKQLPSEFVDRAVLSVAKQIDFLAKNLEFDIGGNHLIKNVKALLWASAALDTARAKTWRELAHALLERELDDQILPDGFHYERSPAYHCQVLVDLLESYYLLRPSGLRERLEEVLAAMAETLRDMTHPDGKCSLFNDGGLHMTYEPELVLQVWQQLTKRNVPAVSRRFDYPDAGFFGLRDGGNLLIVDCGPIAPDCLPAHGHADLLSFEWSIDGKRAVIDTGVYEYNAGWRRDYSRSTKAHNTLTLDLQDQAELWGAFRIGRRPRIIRRSVTGENNLRVVGEHDGYRHMRGRPTHVRTVTATSTQIEIEDRVLKGSGQIARTRLLFHPLWQLEAAADVIWAQDDDGSAVRITGSGELDVAKSKWFPDFGVELVCYAVEQTLGPCPCEGWMKLEVAHR